MTLRVEGADDVTPYPGLAAFTEADALKQTMQYVAQFLFDKGILGEGEPSSLVMRQPQVAQTIGPVGRDDTAPLPEAPLAEQVITFAGEPRGPPGLFVRRLHQHQVVRKGVHPPVDQHPEFLVLRVHARETELAGDLGGAVVDGDVQSTVSKIQRNVASHDAETVDGDIG